MANRKQTVLSDQQPILDPYPHSTSAALGLGGARVHMSPTARWYCVLQAVSLQANTDCLLTVTKMTARCFHNRVLRSDCLFHLAT